eukprot:7621807-Alexandrium_andersonii.AAC.1
MQCSARVIPAWNRVLSALFCALGLRAESTEQAPRRAERRRQAQNTAVSDKEVDLDIKQPEHQMSQ